MTCAHDPYYHHDCDVCIARKLIMLRSPDKKLSRTLQLGVMAGISAERQERVKEILKNER